METLPLEMLLHIASVDYRVWRGMLVIRSFAEHTMTIHCRNYVFDKFCQISTYNDRHLEKKYTETRLCGNLHSFFNFPAKIKNVVSSATDEKDWDHQKNILFSASQKSIKRWWYHHGQKHREGDLPAVEDIDEIKKYYRGGKLHRDRDLPAVVKPCVQISTGRTIFVRRFWYRDGLQHRDRDLPAVTSDYWQDHCWFWEGKLHREGDLPAVIGNEGYFWYQNGKKHRDGDLPAALIPNDRWYEDGKKIAIAERMLPQWYYNGVLHRDGDKPALIDARYTQFWYRGGLLHRDNDKPAVIALDGTLEYWRDGKRIDAVSTEEFGEE